MRPFLMGPWPCCRHTSRGPESAGAEHIKEAAGVGWPPVRLGDGRASAGWQAGRCAVVRGGPAYLAGGGPFRSQRSHRSPTPHSVTVQQQSWQIASSRLRGGQWQLHGITLNLLNPGSEFFIKTLSQPRSIIIVIFLASKCF